LEYCTAAASKLVFVSVGHTIQSPPPTQGIHTSNHPDLTGYGLSPTLPLMEWEGLVHLARRVLGMGARSQTKYIQEWIEHGRWAAVGGTQRPHWRGGSSFGAALEAAPFLWQNIPYPSLSMQQYPGI
jgi:hypothetical protein